MEYLKPGEWRYPLLFTLVVAFTLSTGFLHVSSEIGKWIPFHLSDPRLDKIPAMAGFPLLALLFYLSFPTKPVEKSHSIVPNLWATVPLPLLIALLFGYFHPAPSLIFAFQRDMTQALTWLIWFVFCIPLGEEWLFRGWMHNLVERIWSQKFLTPTNPLPVSVWMTALAFSCWHWQNLGVDPFGFVLFQSLYTFFTGLWLGMLRWQTNSVFPAISAHAGLNLAASLV